MKKLENLNKFGPFFIIFPLSVMLKFTAHFTSVHLFTCVAKAVMSRRYRELMLKISKQNFRVVLKILQVINSPKYVGIRRITCVFFECLKCLDDPERDVT